MGHSHLFLFLTIVVCLVIHSVFYDLQAARVAFPPQPHMQSSTDLPLPQQGTTERDHPSKQNDPEDNDEDHGEPRPSWKSSLDCSIYSLDCISKRHYAPYPFDFWKGNYTFQPDASLPELKQQFLQQQASTQMTLQTKPLNQPQPVSKEDEEKCTKHAKDTPFNQQLNDMLKSLSRAAMGNHVAFTISDIGYAKDMIHDVFAMAHNIVGFPDSFFMVALDDATVELGCRFGLPVLPSPRTGGLEDRVKFTKFQVSYDLAKLGQDFLFFEMDVWFFRSFLPYIQKQTGDMLVSSHQDNPEAMNIGVYAINANDATREYFQHCIDVASLYQIHDQLLMHILSSVSYNQERGKPSEAKHPNVTFQHYVSVQLLNSHEIVSSEWPRVTVESIAIHPLSTAPLMGPHGKMQIAKEFGVYYGSYDYYSSNGRYIWLDRLDNTYSIVTRMPGKGLRLYHSRQAFKWTMATLITIAKRTNRIWVLPRIQSDIGRFFLWKILDLKTVEELGVQVRETNFLSHPKLSHFQSTSRTAVGNQILFWQQDDKEDIKIWKVEEKEQMESLFHLTDSIYSNALLVNPYVVESNWPYRYPFDNNRGSDPTPAEMEIYEVYIKLKWCDCDCHDMEGPDCNFRWLQNFDATHRLTQASAAHDCYGKGELAKMV